MKIPNNLTTSSMQDDLDSLSESDDGKAMKGG
jgi:hypothetical protein